MSNIEEVAHAKRHGAEAEDPWESGFFYGAAFALEERLYDLYHETLMSVRSVLVEKRTKVSCQCECTA